MAVARASEAHMDTTVSTPRIDPEAAKRMLDDGRAVMIDIREPAEFAREHVAGARSAPLSGLATRDLAIEADKAAIFMCRMGARTVANYGLFQSKVRAPVHVLEGGLEAWKRAGLPVQLDRGQPIDLMRQVQIGAGSLAFGGTLLAALVSPWFLVVPGFVGAGLMVAGVTGFCGMARLLRLAPWNRALRAAI